MKPILQHIGQERNKKDREKLKNARNVDKKNANLETEGEDDQVSIGTQLTYLHILY